MTTGRRNSGLIDGAARNALSRGDAAISTTRGRWLPVTSACALLAGLSPVAWSQTSTSTGDQSDQLQEVLVTAQKRTVDLQKAAASITAISGTELAKEGKTQIGDILQQVVGVTLAGSGSTPSEIFVRGIGPQDGSSSSQVAYVVDGVSTSAGVGFNVNVIPGVSVGTVNYDISQVEVERGPQGTSYGGNAGAGAIIIDTNDPVFGKYQASGTVESGSYALLHTEGVLNIPISDEFAARAAFYTDKHDGYFTNGLADDDTSAARIKLAYRNDDNFSAILTGELEHVGGRPTATAWTEDGHLYPNAWTSFDSTDQTNDARTYSLKGKIVYKAPAFTLTVLPYYVQNTGSSFSVANNNTSYSLATSDSYSLETRLDSPDAQPWFWQVGVYDSYVNTPQYDQYAALASLAGQPPGTYPATLQQALSNKAYSTALFGQTSYPVINNVKITAGVRWQVDRTAAADGLWGFSSLNDWTTGCSSTAVTTACLLNIPAIADSLKGGDGTVRTVNYGGTWHNVSFKGGVEWQMTPAQLLYFNVGSGYAPGTSFDFGLNGPGVITSGSQVLMQYALGYKSHFLNNRLQVDGELFNTNYLSYIATYFDPSAGPMEASLKNSAYNRGGDVDVKYLATNADQLGLQVAYLDANYGTVTAGNIISPSSYTAAEINDAVTGLSHHVFQYSPHWTIQPTYSHTFDLKSKGALTLSGNLQYQSMQFTDSSSTPAGENKPHTESNAYLTYADPTSRWTLSAYLKNIENYAYVTRYTPGRGTTPATFYLGAPRTWGLVLNVKL